MIYGQFRTLINLLLVLALGAIFLWGSFRVFGAFSNASPPPATPTPRPVIEQPTIVPTAIPTKPAQKTGGAPVAPTKTPTPRPSPTPQGPAKVIAALSENDNKGSKSFSVASVPLVGGEPELWCRVRNSALPAVGAITFFWYKDPNTFITQYPVSRLSGEFTDGFLKDTDFQTAGSKFHCSVAVNGQQIGSAHFAITP